MQQIFSKILSSLLLYKYVALVGFVFFGSLIIPLPNNTMLIAVGAFSSQGYFHFFLACVLAVIANVVADSTGYFLTHHYGEFVLDKLHLKTHRHYQKVDSYIRNFSGLTVFVTRIVGPFNALVNFLAGFAKIDFRKFILFDIAGNTVGTLLYMSIGYFLGSYWQSFSGIISTIAQILIVCTIAVLILINYLRRKRKKEINL